MIKLKHYKAIELLENKDLVSVCEVLIPNYKSYPISELQSKIDTLYNLPQKEGFVNLIELDGVLYGFNKNKLTFGEFTDLSSYMENFWENIEHIYSLFYRPIKHISILDKLKYKLSNYIYNKGVKSNNQKLIEYSIKLNSTVKYTLEDYDDTKDTSHLFLEVNMNKLFGATLFFYLLIKEYSNDTLNSFQQELNQVQTN